MELSPDDIFPLKTQPDSLRPGACPPRSLFLPDGDAGFDSPPPPAPPGDSHSRASCGDRESDQYASTQPNPYPASNGDLDPTPDRISNGGSDGSSDGESDGESDRESDRDPDEYPDNPSDPIRRANGASRRFQRHRLDIPDSRECQRTDLRRRGCAGQQRRQTYERYL